MSYQVVRVAESSNWLILVINFLLGSIIKLDIPINLLLGLLNRELCQEIPNQD